MNVPAIRKALENHFPAGRVDAAVVRVGLRACDEAEVPCQHWWEDCPCTLAEVRIAVIVDILREAGVEVEG